MSLYIEIFKERHHLSFPHGKTSLGADYNFFQAKMLEPDLVAQENFIHRSSEHKKGTQSDSRTTQLLCFSDLRLQQVAWAFL